MAECVIGYIPNSNGANSNQYVIYKFSPGNTLALPSGISSPIGWFPFSLVINGRDNANQYETAPLFYNISSTGTYGIFQTGITVAFITNHTNGTNARLDYGITVTLTKSNFTTKRTSEGHGWNGHIYLWLHAIIFV